MVDSGGEMSWVLAMSVSGITKLWAKLGMVVPGFEPYARTFRLEFLNAQDKLF